MLENTTEPTNLELNDDKRD